MTDNEMILKIQQRTGETDSAVVQACLEDAKDAIYLRYNPYHLDLDFPEQYCGKVVQLAVRYWARRGGEGEISHSENGITRNYQSVNDEDILRGVVQVMMIL